MRIGVDTGGTFTDVILVDGDRVRTHKRLSTPDDPARAVLEGIDAVLAEAGLGREALSEVVHGSTVATNALLERKGARAAVVTTAGFEDVLEIGRQNRPDLHALAPRREPPVVPAQRRIGARERLAADGSVVAPLEDAEVRRVVEAVRACGAESAAVVLLHGYANGAHEARLAEALEETLGIPVTASHRLLPEYREYERTSTCAVNAYVGPRMAGYLARLSRDLAPARLRVMQSSGGSISAARAGEDAVHTILSGPAGGVVGAGRLARLAGESRLVTFDMGGTSTDVCLVDGEPTVTNEAVLGGHPIRVPLVDIHTVGAGGGSIAWRDAGGALRVGPRSAGADPGPACYGRGGEAPTVTDAHLVLGRLPASGLLGGGLRLDHEAALAAVGRLAADLGLETRACAEGIVRVANAVMARAVRRISLERGHDPRRFALVSFGGAGGLHACDLADLVAIPRILVPRHPGLLSAYGLLAAPASRERARSVLVRASAAGVPTDAPRLDAAYAALAHELVEELAGEGQARGTLVVERRADLRYVGQSYELTVEADAGPEETVGRFHAAHERAFGYRLDREVEWVAARVRVSAPATPPPAPASPEGGSAAGGLVDRDELGEGARLDGPAVVVEYSATTFVAPGWRAEVVEGGALRLVRR